VGRHGKAPNYALGKRSLISKKSTCKSRVRNRSPFDLLNRIILENKTAAEEPPKKKRKRFGGVEAEDMTLVSPENAAQRPGWKVSSMGRITKPVKMRPTHPLPDVIDDKSKKKAGVKGLGEEGEKKKKKRVKDPDTRARRKVIDMTKYGSTHLKGMFLDIDVPLPTPLPERYKDIRPNNEEFDSDIDSEDSDDAHLNLKAVKTKPQTVPPKKIGEPIGSSNTEAKSMPIITHTPEPTHIPTPTMIPTPIPTSIPAPPPAPKTKPTKPVATSTPPPTLPPNPPSSDIPDKAIDIQQEKAKSLNLLNSLFGSNDDDDWVGQEDVDSDIDISELVKGDRMLVDDEDPGFEVVPLNAPVRNAISVPEEEESDSEEEKEDAKHDDNMDIDQKTQSAAEETHATNSKPKTLKDLFAPREEEGNVSLSTVSIFSNAKRFIKYA
jgi:hypothetical protein